jgi:NAD(P)-dependent dehydrogenase (short-subunit alcohol dehydrogenase family)
MELQGKTAFVTGGGGGIGGGMAEAFAEVGMNVVVADIDLADAERQAGKIESAGLAVGMDVASLESWAQARETALAAFGQVDVLCNNAGISVPWEPLVEVEPETFERVMRINVFGVYNGIKTFAPDMIARGYGHVCNTSSLNGLISMGTMGPYSASKFAVTALSDALRDELAPHGIGVSAIYPGLTRSKMGLETTSGRKTPAVSVAMMEPIWLGRAVVAAIRNGTPHIISHPAHKANVERRHAALIACFGEPAEPGFTI